MYDKLAYIQGDYISRMLAHVHLLAVESSEIEDKIKDSPFLRINRVLLKYVSGIPLSNLENYPPIPNRRK